MAEEDSSIPVNVHPDLHSSETEVPPPVKKTAAARSVSPVHTNYLLEKIQTKSQVVKNM